MIKKKKAGKISSREKTRIIKKPRQSRKRKSDAAASFKKLERKNRLPVQSETEEEPQFKSESPQIESKIKEGVKILRGMRDVFGDEMSAWDYVVGKLTNLAEDYNFKKIIVPVLEKQLLFEKTTGLTTEVVGKQMYQFRDKAGNQVVLRPEFTPSVARAYLEQGMSNLPQPVKLYYFGPLFRYERPQAGRLRQFHQFGLEVIGSAEPAVDAQLILFSQTLFNNLGIKADIQVNSLGCVNCRKAYRAKLVNYFKFKRKWLCSDCQRRLNQNPLRILDCQNEDCKKLVQQAPQLVDDLCDECRNHFVRTLEYLDEAGVVYILNPYLVRGLDYYTRTVFEVWPNRADSLKKIQEKGELEIKEEAEKFGSQSALGGGGRYDSLIEGLGGHPTPASGLAYGLERIIEESKIQNIRLPRLRSPQVFLAQVGERASRRALKIFDDLQKQGLRVAENLAKNSLKSQMEAADKLGVKLTLILGQQEVIDNTIIIRNMSTGNQEVVDQNKIFKELKKRIR